MSSIMKHEKPKVMSLERLVELAEQKRAVVFNNGIIKPAAVVLNMQGAVIAAMIRNGNLFEYIKPVSEKKPMTFYRSGKAKRPLYAEIEKQNREMKEAAIWILHLHHGISKDNERDTPSEEEWKVALETLTKAIQE